MDFDMVKFVEKIQALDAPAKVDVDGFHYTDKKLERITDPAYPEAMTCSTLVGLSDLWKAGLDGLTADDVLVQVFSPFEVRIWNRKADKFARRKLTAVCRYPTADIPQLKFGNWQDPESFIISAQQCFQRVKVQNDDGSYAQDLDYVLKICSSISSEQAMSNDDDGIAQRVSVKRGVTLKAEEVLRPRVNLAPYRTFSDIDQILVPFIFRAKFSEDGEAKLALFEGDGGRWKIEAQASIKAFLATLFGTVPVTS